MGLVAVRNFCLFVVVVVVEGKLWSWVVENSEQFAASWRSTNREVICVFVVIVVGFLLLLLLWNLQELVGKIPTSVLFVSAVTPPNCFFFHTEVGWVCFFFFWFWVCCCCFWFRGGGWSERDSFLIRFFQVCRRKEGEENWFCWADFVSCSIIHLWRCAAAWGSLDMIMGSTVSRLPGWGPRRERRTK